jgi:UDP-GlcNAc:undecaprenyl-phosphate GlcNAc-1-phosphate transferase
MSVLGELRAAVFDPPMLRVAYGALTAFVIVWLSIPVIIRTSRLKGVLYEPNHRSSHSGAVPRLGGVAIFAGIAVASLIFMQFEQLMRLQYVMAGILILFLVGIKDDLSCLSPWYKLAGEVAACLAVILPGRILFTTVHGFIGFSTIHPVVGVLLTLFVMIVIINSFNLIDGIDGLAAGVGIVVFASFGVWFFLSGHYEVLVIAAAGIGALLAFLWYNVFSRKHKIFMGDSGSLVLGFIASFFVILFNEYNRDWTVPYHIWAAPAVAMGILVLPLFDTLRVFFIRTLRSQSPFHADRQHLHHMLLELGLSHGRATAILVGFNILFVIVTFLLSTVVFSVLKLILILLIGCIVLSEILNQLLIRKLKKTTPA